MFFYDRQVHATVSVMCKIANGSMKSKSSPLKFICWRSGFSSTHERYSLTFHSFHCTPLVKRQKFSLVKEIPEHITSSTLQVSNQRSTWGNQIPSKTGEGPGPISISKALSKKSRDLDLDPPLVNPFLFAVEYKLDYYSYNILDL